MQIQISVLLQKPTDLDLHCLLRQGMSCSAREGLKRRSKKQNKTLGDVKKTHVFCSPVLVANFVHVASL